MVRVSFLPSELNVFSLLANIFLFVENSYLKYKHTGESEQVNRRLLDMLEEEVTRREQLERIVELYETGRKEILAIHTDVL